MELAQLAEESGFSHAAGLDVATLRLLDEVRAMCAADKCRLYGRSWMCPPACGTLEENTKQLLGYTRGVIVQTTRELEDDFDIENMDAIGAKHKELFYAFVKKLRAQYPGLLPLGSGGCTLCESCAYPDAPCRQPEEAFPSMEAYGLLVSEVCTSNGLGYYYGPQTMTYTSCLLVE